MKYLNYKQLAFVLDISPIKALEKIIAIHCKLKGINTPEREDKATDYLFSIVVKNNKEQKVRNSMPETMEVSILAEHLNLPTLQQSVDDITGNYLNRPASKKWILCDFPEKQLISKEKKKIKIPPALKSMLPDKQIKQIQAVWFERFGIPS